MKILDKIRKIVFVVLVSTVNYSLSQNTVLDNPEISIFSAVASKRIRENSDFTVSIYVERSVTSPLRFTLYLKSYEEFYKTYNYDSEDEQVVNVTTLATSESVSVRPGTTENVTINVGLLSERRYNLTLVATDENGSVFEDFNLVIKEENNKKESLLIHSDKVIYKPGETVKFRVLLLNKNLRPIDNETLEVTLTDSQQNVIKIWKSFKIFGGIFSSEIKLSEEPLQGDWKLEAKTQNSETTYSFSVEEYVLPKFKVEILPPNYITFDTPKFVVEVKAAYTFGKKIVGECEIKISEEFVRYHYRRREPKVISKNSLLDGSAFFEVDVQAEFENSVKLSQEKTYTLTATVTEGLIGRKMNATAVQVKAYSRDFKFEAVNTRDKFKPGLPFTFNFKIVTHDGRPVGDPDPQAVKFHHGLSCSDEDEFKFSAIPPSGLVSFLIGQMPTNELMGLANVELTYKDLTEKFRSPTRHTSKTKSYMELSLSSTSIASNSKLDLSVKSNKVISSLTVILFGRGQVVTTETLTFDPTKEKVVSLVIPSLAAPTAKIVVYTILEPGRELVAESQEILVTNFFDNYLTLKLPKPVAKPGENLSITMITMPRSVVLLRGVDQSVLLLKQDKDITANVIEEEFKAFLPGSDSYRLRGGSSTFQIFEETGIIIFTNSKLEREKPMQRERVLHRIHMRKKVTMLESEVYDEVIENTMVDYDGDMMPGGQMAPAKKAITVRKHFPETWIWQEMFVNQSEISVVKTVPDTLTSWVLSGYSLNLESGIGVLQKPLTLKVFRPFFLTLNKPYSIVKGEVFGLQILVHNYFEANLSATVTVKNLDAAFQFLEAENKVAESLSQEIVVPSNDVKAITMVIRPVKFGPMKLDVSAVCDVAGDAVCQILIVKPPGQKQERNQAVLLDLREESAVNETLRTEFPENRVEGADSVKITVISDLLGSTVKNLDKLLKMPYGCGEQNMVTFVPDIVILEYLKAIGKLSDEIKAKATQFLEVGYQRELTYRHDDGSFSAFGKSDQHGSTWLTAFVVRSFVAAQPHITVDSKIIESALEFLSSKQADDGRFADDGRLLNSAMKGGAADEYSLSAYVLLSFMEVRKSPLNSKIDFASVVSKGLEYITRTTPEHLGLYPLTLATFALHSANHSMKGSYQSQLEILATKHAGLTFWEPPKDSNRSQDSYQPSTKPLSVEVTAYSLLMYLRDGALEKTLSTGKWLLGQRNAEGGFISTQDTVVGLTALGKFALATQSSSVALVIKAGEATFEVNSDNAMVLQEVNFASTTQEVNFKASGSGTALAQLSWSYYIENNLATPDFLVDVKVVEAENKGSLNLEICASYQSADGKSSESNMVVMEVNLPSGYAFEKDELSSLQGTHGIKRTDLDKGSTLLNIYFEYLNSNQRCIQVPASRVFKVADPAESVVLVYDYYDTTRQGRAFYSPPGLLVYEI